jgi:hypothetical protein
MSPRSMGMALVISSLLASLIVGAGVTFTTLLLAHD